MTSDMTSSGPTLGRLVAAEMIKLASRQSVRLSVLLLVVISVVIPLGMFAMTQMVVTSGPDGAQATPFTFSAAAGLDYVLTLRNFFLFRLLIIAVVAVMIAGEFKARTLREDLMRPVSRLHVLTSKLVALQAFVVAGVVIPLVVATPIGGLLFGDFGDLLPSVRGYVLTWLGDVGFCTMVLAIAMVVRSVSGTIGGVCIYWLFDQSLGWVLWGVEQGRELIVGTMAKAGLDDLVATVDMVIALRPWLPSAAFNVYWDYVPEAPLQWQSYVSLLLITVLAFAVAARTFARVDID